ncbi:uncharacterized protein LOC110189992 [Drosophila serrata]|uniref:uncharacterized protein LOC110189992 n=1 Tax=Drosophila serrata TaxID=7274 RepID=UPI000A1D1803|nr:uncharacterized protein LOC110189992 [Drosophila serrata]
MSNYDEKINVLPEMEYPCEMLIDRFLMDPGQNTQNKPGDSDFSMNGGLNAFLRAKSLVDPDKASISDVQDDMRPSEQDDLHPWMRCCGRNFKHSVFSLQPSRAPKRGLGRHRRGLSRAQLGQPNP